MASLTELATQFLHRFAGLDRAHGHYVVKGDGHAGNKQSGSAVTERTGPTLELWKKHLRGEYGIGIVPIRDDATCVFGAVDIDSYNLDFSKLEDDIARLQLPLIICRTKSGGAHLYLFTNEAVPAELIRGKLMDWAVALGHSGVEVFPKQVKLAGPNDYGNWINMPYFSMEQTNRYAVAGGKPINAKEFLSLAQKCALTHQQLKDLTPPQNEETGELFKDAPPCLQSLAQRGFGEGSRNNALFNVGVYLRKRFPDDWEQRLDVYNQRFMTPPLGHKEVSQIQKHLAKKDYQYKCHDQPIVGVCNRQICLTRQFGIGGGADDPGVVFGSLIKIETNPPTWIWDVDGARMELTTGELRDQSRFHSKCIDALNKWPNLVKPKTWVDLIRDKLKTVEVRPAPPDATPEGQVMMMLEDYCSSKMAARAKEELLLKKPWTDEAGPEPRTYFSGNDFAQWLKRQRHNIEIRDLWNVMRRINGTSHRLKIKGKNINVWSVPAFSQQTEPFEIPTVPAEEPL